MIENIVINWEKDYKRDFICPNPKCGAKGMVRKGRNKSDNKMRFKCNTCGKMQMESLNINAPSHIKHISVRPFDWLDNHWDLRSINPNFEERDRKNFIANFNSIKPDWFEQEVKKYIHFSCKYNSSFAKIGSDLSILRTFSIYLIKIGTKGFNEINRNLILAYFTQERLLNKSKIGGLRKFFITGNIRGWFNIDPDIIRKSDYPKQYRSDPDPISDLVREQIEQNLHKLPDPIARMWLICYFSAMRPAELAYLKQDCLVKEGQDWELVWRRKKTDDYHRIPITQTIAKVVQEQQEYIQNIWGNEWEYLFCQYRKLSQTELLQTKLTPVKQVLSGRKDDSFITSIRDLIKLLDIRDENGQLAKFQQKLLRSTRLTELFEKGHDLDVVSKWAGHKYLSTTSTYYTKVSCDLMVKEAGHIHQALVNINGRHIRYESLPQSFWENQTAHKVELSGTHLNTPIYGFCGQPLTQDCHKFRACYTCNNFVATIEKLPQYINSRNELREKEAQAMSKGQAVPVEQYSRQADQLDKIIASLQEEAA